MAGIGNRRRIAFKCTINLVGFFYSRAAPPSESARFLARAATLGPNQAETAKFSPPTLARIKDFTLLGNCLVAGLRRASHFQTEARANLQQGDTKQQHHTQHVPLEGKHRNIRNTFFLRLTPRLA